MIIQYSTVECKLSYKSNRYKISGCALQKEANVARMGKMSGTGDSGRHALIVDLLQQFLGDEAPALTFKM